MAKIHVEYYRGCEIYKLTPPSAEETVYGSECVRLLYKTKRAVKKRICQGQGWDWIDEKCVEPEEPTPPPPPEPYLEEVYRDVEIWWVPALSAFRAEVAPGYVATSTILTVIRELIDEILEFLYPPEDPDAGLFAQVVAAIKAWIDPILTPLKVAWDGFITETWPALGTAFTKLQGRWDAFKTETLPGITGWLDTLRDRWDVFWTETLPSIWIAIDAKLGILKAALNEDLADLRESMEQGLADNREWMENFGKLMDPVGFLKDPLGYISAAFGIQRLLAETLVVRSFWEGFEEGLAEEE